MKVNINDPEWYSKFCVEAKLIEYGPVKGTIILRPFGLKIWENIKQIFSNELLKIGVEEIKFPTLIPLNLIQKEKEHFQGLNPELAIIDKVGLKKLDSPLTLRPTSEVLFCQYFKKTLQTYKDLPILLNQWCSVFRWEKNTKPFLRNSEFYWQEGHTIHRSNQDAILFAEKIWKLYLNFVQNKLLIACFKGKKTEIEKFAGAKETYTVECFLKDGQALQCATSHYLGQNFTKPFEIKFQNIDNKYDYPFQTSWGLSMRIIGALILSHNDSEGILLPKNISPYHIVIIPIFFKNDNKELFQQYINNLISKLKGFKVFFDNNFDVNFIKKRKLWTMRGIPIIIEIGMKEIEQQIITIFKRINFEKTLINVNSDNLVNQLTKLLDNHDKKLLQNSKSHLLNNQVHVYDFESFKKAIDDKKLIKCYFKYDSDIEKKIKELTGATIRCILFDNVDLNNKCFFTNQIANMIVFFSRAY